MSRRSLPANDARTDRKNAKRTARRAAHRDKYADRRPDPSALSMGESLAALADRFNSAEARRG